MNLQSKLLSFSVVLLALLSNAGQAEDIDIFSGTTPTTNPTVPNVIFILDNTSNWTRQAQKWPEAAQQGQSEIEAILAVLSQQIDQINVGIMEYNTGGSAGDRDSGFVRFDLQYLDSAGYAAIETVLTTIHNNIGSPTEKRDASNPYGDLMWDFYNYLDGGNQSNNGVGTLSIADNSAYSTPFSVFQSPLTTDTACVATYLIFMANNAQGGIAGDSSANSVALEALYTAAGTTLPHAIKGTAGTPLPLRGFSTVVSPGNATNIGSSGICYKFPKANDDTEAQCTADEHLTGGSCLDGSGTVIENCSCTASNEAADYCSGNGGNKKYRFSVASGGAPTTEIMFDSGPPDTTGGEPLNMDDWALFLRNYGIPYTTAPDPNHPTVTVTENVSVITYVIDVFNAQRNGKLSSMFYSASDVGGGKYFEARSKSAIQFSLNSIFNDILAVSSSFASVSLPLSTTNRAKVENQVYIGLFRPSPGKKPRWFGNLKQYQFARFDGVVELADVNLNRAINPLTGFPGECAASLWTTDSATYWQSLGLGPATKRGECSFVMTSEWSDLPDGSSVEKGGAAQMSRESNSRTIYTVSGSSLPLLDATNGAMLSAGGDPVLNYLIGTVPGGDGEVMPDPNQPGAGIRPSIHGDVVHSRPLSVNYGSGVVSIFYGANDGLYRAVNGTTGAELWSLIVPEHFSKIQRLYDNAPEVQYTGIVEDVPPYFIPKDYFFDGPTGEFITYDASDALETAWIYPTMRRGGRMIYAIDVTDPSTPPSLLWKHGCPNPDNDSGCTTGFSSIGQTWSTPRSGFLESYPDTGTISPKQPIVIFGGGFDDCLNADTAAYPSAACTSAKGSAVYIVNAETGVLEKTFSTDAPVITEVSTVDMEPRDGYIDFAYVADVAGNLYRISFSTIAAPVDGKVATTPLVKADWNIVKIAATSGNQKRFYNPPVAATFRGINILTIGSGDRERPLEINYPYSSSVQNTFYTLFDRPWITPATLVNLDAMLEVSSTNTPALNKYSTGWYMDLPDRGEQVANGSAIGGGLVLFNTFQPGGATSGLCTKPLGIGTSYAINVFGPQYTVGEEITGGGLPVPPVIVTVTVPEGCQTEYCDTAPVCAANDPTCQPTTISGCIGGCDKDRFGLRPLDPNVDPTRSRSYWIEDIDR